MRRSADNYVQMRLREKTLAHAYTSRTSANRLTEAVDKQKMAQITAALNGLAGLVPDGAASFKTGIENAKNDLGKYVQGGITQAFKNVFSDPVKKSITLANALRDGMSNLSTLAQIYLPQGSEKETQKSIWDLTPTNKQKELIATFVKAFKKEGIAELLKGPGLPYVDNLQLAVQELLQNTNPQGAFKLASQASSTQELPEEPTAEAPVQGDTKSTKTSDKATPSDQTDATKQSQASTISQVTAKTGKVAADDEAQISDLANFVAKNAKVDATVAKNVITALAKNGKITN